VYPLLHGRTISLKSPQQSMVRYQDFCRSYKEPEATLQAISIFLQCLMKLKDSHFIDCNNATKSGVVDYIFDNKPKYLLLDELDKLSRKDQTFLLNLMETGIVSETKYNKTRKMEIRTSIFATSNNLEK
jgi:Holliday junction DNA helicase RuvB